MCKNSDFTPRIPVNEYAPLLDFEFKLDTTDRPDLKGRKKFIFFFIPKRPESMRDVVDFRNLSSWSVIPLIFNVDSFERTGVGHKILWLVNVPSVRCWPNPAVRLCIACCWYEKSWVGRDRQHSTQSWHSYAARRVSTIFIRWLAITIISLASMALSWTLRWLWGFL